MRPAGRRAVAAAALLAAVTSAEAARADDDVLVAFAVAGLALLGGTDVTFTAYSGGTAARVEEPDQAWMTAQSIITTPQALAANVGMAALAAEDDDEGYSLLGVPVVAWLNSLSVYSTWSVGAPGKVAPDQRFGVSWLAGTNAAFTSTAIGALADERVSPLWISIPEVGLMGAEAAFTTVRAVQDEKWRGGWVALAAWSGVLTIHGLISIVGDASGWNRDDTPPPIDIAPPPPPPPPPNDPLQVPFDPSAPPATPPARPEPPGPPPPMLVPAPVGEGAGLGPGVAVVGMF
ncbi:MAG: hypothetical protein JNL21_02755 [Myxococcales bacterium]|nr:hypothetical protein [Myxococcales bacterium]